MARDREEELELYAHDVGTNIIQIMRKLRSPGSAFKEELELSMPQTMLLAELNETGTASMSELSNRLKITPGVTTRMVDRLLEKGLVERERDQVDRRMVRVSPSKRGREYAEKMAGYYREKIKAIFRGVSMDEREEFLMFLQKINQQLEEG